MLNRTATRSAKMATHAAHGSSQRGPHEQRQQHPPSLSAMSAQFVSHSLPLSSTATAEAAASTYASAMASKKYNGDESDDSSDDSELETVYDSKVEQIQHIEEPLPNPLFGRSEQSAPIQAESVSQQDENAPFEFQILPNNHNHGRQMQHTFQTDDASTRNSTEDEAFMQPLPAEQIWTPDHGDAVMIEELTNLIDLEESVPSATASRHQPFDSGISASVANGQSQHDKLSSDYLQQMGGSMVNGDVSAPLSTQDPNMDNLMIEPLPYDNGHNHSAIDAAAASKKRKWHLHIPTAPMPAKFHSSSSAHASAQSRAQHMPGWMKYNTNVLPSSTPAQQFSAGVEYVPLRTSSFAPPHFRRPGMLVSTSIPMKPGYIPTWKRLLPREFLIARKEREEMATERKHYSLSVLNVNEFTISGVSLWSGARPSSVRGLRAQIRRFSSDYGKAVFERDIEEVEGGKWRIPLGAYQALLSYLTSLPNTRVEGIPQAHLNIAMLGRQRLEKGCPTVQKMVHIGVPFRLANTLAPFQRSGVDFVYERHGRALIADEMGLGKTIQAIASIAIYHEDWPVLVLTPSGARYHWENEFLNWLGPENNDRKLLDFGNEGEVDAQEEEDLPGPRKAPMPPLLESQINVLTKGASAIIPNHDTKVVIVSYGLAPKLVEEGKLVPGMFKCAIVDESHMLKNKNSKRTKGLMPVLKRTLRCILLSGTPAFARPIELWPQMNILGSAEDPSFTDEAAFVNKYVKGRSKNRLAELHTVLTGTLMIRRMKNDILKQLPPKLREQALVNIMDDATREEFRIYLEDLRMGKGALANIARSHEGSSADKEEIPHEARADQPRSTDELKGQVQEEARALLEKKRDRILQSEFQGGDPTAAQVRIDAALGALNTEVEAFYHQRFDELKSANDAIAPPTKATADESSQAPKTPFSKKAMLIQMYKRTGQIKIPLVADMLKMWMDNPTKGKLCIFAHHISVLNEIGSLAGLSNEAGSTKSFIRIDGSTNPRQRQEQINAFQKDPTIRVALLGITAAGVAVTLTAASTVWFAELFWTPALLIQAEDRCHRIGQQAKCRCLYIVAKGSLDEILWKHIEKKFRDLGEFVEGKEKMKIVVHRKYRGALELKKSLEIEKIEFDDEEEPEFDHSDDVAEELESQLHQDIEELEREEQEMLRAEAAEDDDGDMEGSGKASGIDASATAAGSTETEAICLSDDEDVEEVQALRKSLQEEGLAIDREFPDLQLYKMKFPAPNCGLVIARFKGRVVVQGKADYLPITGRPNVGDILLACNNDEIVPNINLNALLRHFDGLMQRYGEVEILFAEDKEFSAYFTNPLNSHNRERDAFMPEDSPLQGLSAKISSLPTYTVAFDGVEDYGFRIEAINSIFFVSSISPSRMHQHGADAVPSVGDVLLSINGAVLRVGLTAAAVMIVLNTLKEKGMASQLTFAAADEAIVSMVLSRVAAPQPSTISLTPPSNGRNEVIELLDD